VAGLDRTQESDQQFRFLVTKDRDRRPVVWKRAGQVSGQGVRTIAQFLVGQYAVAAHVSASLRLSPAIDAAKKVHVRVSFSWFRFVVNQKL
jgi:hypothetical protein